MRVRVPSFDFSRVSAHWIPRAPEFAQLLNANSIVLPHLERFVNRVMARARAEIRGDDLKAIRAEMSLFMKQESCHHAVHTGFNAMMVRNGYDQIPEIEKDIARYYDQLLATKSLPFLIGYCEGFESLTPPMAATWFDGTMDRVLTDADPDVVMMWRWHIMEEFEHRTVCHDVYRAVHGGYLLRIYAFFYQFVAFHRMVARTYRYFLNTDRLKMRPDEIARSKQHARRSASGFLVSMTPGMLNVLRPRYSPRNIVEPAGLARARNEIESDWIPSDAAAIA